MTNSKGTSKKKTKEVVEEVQVVKSYLTPILFKREPVEKNIPVADLFYRVDGNLIELQCHAPNQEAAVEQIIAGDISITNKTGSVTMISKSTSPIEWISNLCKSNEFSGNPFIAEEVQKLYEA